MWAAQRLVLDSMKNHVFEVGGVISDVGKISCDVLFFDIIDIESCLTKRVGVMVNGQQVAGCVTVVFVLNSGSSFGSERKGQ